MVSTNEKAQTAPGDCVVIVGGGAVGQLTALSAQADATRVVAPAMREDSPLLLLEDGELWSSTPNDEFIGLMMELANLLDARVRGDELETYRTLDEVCSHPDDEPLRGAAATARPRQSALWREWKGRLVVMGIGLLFALGYIVISGKRGRF